MSLPMSRTDIADYLGLTIETVSRAISEFEGRGLVTRFAARKIEVNGRSKLRTIDAQFVVGRGNLADPAGHFASSAP
jgi:CRP/FNR family nitrogen fixation transcriptional regulator